MPKQFLKLFNNKSLFQLTFERNKEIFEKQFIVSNKNQYFLVLDQLEELKLDNKLLNVNFLLEPVGRNTASAIALACLALDKEEIVFITPSDHLIKNIDQYKKTIKKAETLANENYLITFGIEPSEPNDGYGYIEAKIENDISNYYDVIKFHEKPDVKTAEKYLQQNSNNSQLPTTHYFWNSGMFMFKAGIFLDELKKYSPEIFETSLKAYKNAKKDNIIRINYNDMIDIPNNSIDYAVMEKSKIVKVIPSNFKWNDVGSFDSLIKEVDSKVDKIEIDSKNNFYLCEKKSKVVATIGLENFIIIDTSDALLITKKGQTQKVKNIVNQLKTTHNTLLTSHSKVHRPWGTYEVLIDEDNYKLKRIVVKPGKRLSLQKHFHRNEHWIVVSGTAKVQVGTQEYLVRPNESTYIKMGEIHRLSNPGKIPVVLIEAQVGEYTGEDDIIRIEDDYERY